MARYLVVLTGRREMVAEVVVDAADADEAADMALQMAERDRHGYIEWDDAAELDGLDVDEAREVDPHRFPNTTVVP